MENEKVYKMEFSKIYPLLVNKAVDNFGKSWGQRCTVHKTAKDRHEKRAESSTACGSF